MKANEALSKFNLGIMRASKSKSVRRGNIAAGIISIVYSGNGKRFTLPLKVAEKLGIVDSLQVGFADDGLLISKHFSDDYPTFYTRQNDSKCIVYAAELVKEIIDEYELDFTDKKCLTFYDHEFSMDEENPIIFIKMRDVDTDNEDTDYEEQELDNVEEA